MFLIDGFMTPGLIARAFFADKGAGMGGIGGSGSESNDKKAKKMKIEVL